MSKTIKKMAVRYKPLLEEHDSTCRSESSLDKIFSPGCYAVEIDHTGADVGLPVDDCKEEHYIVGSLVVTDCGTVGPKQHNRVMGQALTFTSRTEKTTKVYTRTFADGKWGKWRSLAETGVFENITSPEELVYTVEELVNMSSNQNSRIEDIEKADVMSVALDSFVIVGDVTDKLLEYHSYFKNVNVVVTDEQKSAKYDLSSIALCLLRKGYTDGQAEIRWSAINTEKNLREYVLGYNIRIDLSSANAYGYTHIEQENTSVGLKISYDVNLNAPLPKSLLIYGSSGAAATMLLQKERVSMSFEGVVKSAIPMDNAIVQPFVNNKGHYIKLTNTVLDGVSKAPVDATADDAATYAMVNVAGGETFVISAMGTADVASWAVIGKDGYVVKGYTSGVGENVVEEHTVIMPTNAAKLVVNSWSTVYCSIKQVVSPINDIPVIYKKIDNNKTLINKETARAKESETELLARIQGTSDASNAMRDPFKSLGIINSIEEMLTLLDSLCSNVAGTNDYGKFRINLNGVNVYVTNYVLGRDNQVFAQEIYAPIEIVSVVGKEESYLTADESAASYVHITRKYAQELKLVTNWRATGSSRTLRRTHHKDNGWSNWVDTSSPYIASPLYGKNILLIGGSFAHNMRAFSNGLGFTIDKKDYSMQNYLAEQLGLNHLDNFAIQGEGSCITEGVFLKRNTLEQFKLAAQKAGANNYSYDAIILVGGLNDFQMGVPVGKLSDATTAGTFCAGLKALTNEIRATYSTAKILFTTPFKATRSEPWDDAFWNPLSTRTNSAGYRFAEYIQAIKEVAHLRSIPLLDIYSICQIDTHNAGKLLLSDLVHPNGQGYLTVAPAMLDFIAWQKGSAVFCNDALQMNLKQELGEQIEDNASKILQNTGNIEKLGKSINSKETELLARIQGTSDASNAMTDPFKFVGSFNSSTIGNLRDWMDGLHGKDYTLDNRGVYRATLNDSPIEITSSPIAYGNETTSERYLQVVSGRVSIESSTGLLTFGSEYCILNRVYNNNEWSEWSVVVGSVSLQNLHNDIDKIKNFEPAANVYWSVTGVGKMAKSTSGNYQSVIIPVIAGERYVVTATGAGNARTFATLDADKVCVRMNADDDYQFTNREITIKDGEAYLVVNSKNSVALVCHLAGSLVAAIKKETENMAQNIEAGFKQIAYPLSENENYLTLEQGTIGNTGIDSPSDTYFRSNYIAIDGEPVIIANGSVLYRYYNEDKQFTGTEYTADSRFLRIVFARRPSAYEKVYITTATATTEYSVSRYSAVAEKAELAYNKNFAIKEIYFPNGVIDNAVLTDINSIWLKFTESNGGYAAGFSFYNKSGIGLFDVVQRFATESEAAEFLNSGFIDMPHCKILFNVKNAVHNSTAYLNLDDKVFDLHHSPIISAFHCKDKPMEGIESVNGQFIGAGGTVKSSAGYSCTEPIALAKGNTIRVALKAADTVAAVSLFEAGVYTPICIGVGTGHRYLYEYTAEDDCLVAVSYETSSLCYISIVGDRENVVPELAYTMNYYMLGTGQATGTTNSKFGYSSPFRVYKGDYLRLKLKASSTTAVLSKSDETGKIIDCIYKAADEAEASYTYFVKEDGYMVVSGNTSSIDLKIERTNPARAALDATAKSLDADAFKREKRYYIDEVGFAPEVASGILVYEGDTKSQNNFVVNAVAYPDGTIIACRAASADDTNGYVVRIDNDGNETVLLTIGLATDWRCCFMDRNLNVYVSPHSGIRPTGANIDKEERGLYRLAYGSNEFVKVIGLYNPDGDSAVATENESNDDTIWTMCEDCHGALYAGVYAHSARPNPAIYKSVDGGVTWEYKFNFITAGMTSEDDRRGRARHIHSLIYNPYNFSLYCVVGEVETVFKSSDGGDTWIDLDIRVEDTKATAMIAVPDGVIMASDGSREGVISKLYADDKTVKTVGKMWHGIFFGIKKSDITGNIYALSRLESALQNSYPPREAIGNPQALEDWKTSVSGNKVLTWQMYHDNIHKYYGHDEYMPIRYAILMSRDNGESWEIIHSADTGYTEGEGCGIQCSGYFRNGELCCGVTNEVNGVKTFVNPVIISEGQKRYKSGKPDISGEIFAKMNDNSSIA